jgi:hypothetical protein
MQRFYADGNGHGANRIRTRIDIDDDWIPSVQIFRPEINWEAWQIMERYEETMQSIQKRMNRSPHVKKMIWGQMTASNLKGENAWIKSSASVLVHPSDFHPILQSRASKLIRAGLHEKSPRSRFIFVLHPCFTTPKRDRVVIYERGFRVHIPGYLHLDIGQWLQGDDEFDRLIRSENEFLIVRGRYVSAWAQSIFERNSVDGLVLDTTWKVIRKYVTTIMMAVYRNVEDPLRFAFGAAETIELYEQHFGAFSHLFGIDFSHYILKSDQGSALCLLCTSKEQAQLFCLLHFLLFLKQKEFSC